MKRKRDHESSSDDSSSSDDDEKSDSSDSSPRRGSKRSRGSKGEKKRSKRKKKPHKSGREKKDKKSKHSKKRKREKEKDRRRSKRDHEAVDSGPDFGSGAPSAVSAAQAALQRIREQDEAARVSARWEEAEAVAAAAAGGRASRGPMTAADQQREAERVKRVYEPETGRMRLVKGDGEIVEEIVSREQQEAIRKRATMTSTAASAGPSSLLEKGQWTGKEKFPSQHPWFGYG